MNATAKKANTAAESAVASKSPRQELIVLRALAKSNAEILTHLKYSTLMRRADQMAKFDKLKARALWAEATELFE